MMDRIRDLKGPFWITLGLMLICGGFYTFLSRGDSGAAPYIEAAETAIQRTFEGEAKGGVAAEVPLDEPLPASPDPRPSASLEEDLVQPEDATAELPVLEPRAEEAAETPPMVADSFLPQIMEEKTDIALVPAAATPPPCAEPATSADPPSVSARPVQDIGAEVPAGRALIAEISIGGAGENDKDRIALYNTSAEAVDVSGWKLRKRAKTGGEYSIKVLGSGAEVLPGGYFIWANAKFGDGANATSSETLAANNSVALFDKGGDLIDAVAWGGGHVTPYIEGDAFPENPKDGAILVRKIVDGKMRDSGDNASDFKIN